MKQSMVGQCWSTTINNWSVIIQKNKWSIKKKMCEDREATIVFNIYMFCNDQLSM